MANSIEVELDRILADLQAKSATQKPNPALVLPIIPRVPPKVRAQVVSANPTKTTFPSTLPNSKSTGGPIPTKSSNPGPPPRPARTPPPYGVKPPLNQKPSQKFSQLPNVRGPQPPNFPPNQKFTAQLPNVKGPHPPNIPPSIPPNRPNRAPSPAKKTTPPPRPPTPPLEEANTPAEDKPANDTTPIALKRGAFAEDALANMPPNFRNRSKTAGNLLSHRKWQELDVQDYKKEQLDKYEKEKLENEILRKEKLLLGYFLTEPGALVGTQDGTLILDATALDIRTFLQTKEDKMISLVTKGQGIIQSKADAAENDNYKKAEECKKQLDILQAKSRSITQEIMRWRDLHERILDEKKRKQDLEEYKKDLRDQMQQLFRLKLATTAIEDYDSATKYRDLILRLHEKLVIVEGMYRTV